jgi:hypothetical protein
VFYNNNNNHHHHVHEGLGVFPVPQSSRWSWSLHLFLGRPIFYNQMGLNKLLFLCTLLFVVVIVYVIAGDSRSVVTFNCSFVGKVYDFFCVIRGHHSFEWKENYWRPEWVKNKTVTLCVGTMKSRQWRSFVVLQ